MHHKLTTTDREALSQRIPLPQLLSLAGQGPRLTVDQLAHTATLELELKRRALSRIKAGEVCMVPLARMHPNMAAGLEAWRTVQAR